MSTDESICLTLAAEPGSIGVARRAVADLAEGHGVTERVLGDVKTVVTEACTNVVKHAYPLGNGQFEVEAASLNDSLSIVVRDFGVGVRVPVNGGEPSTRLGLRLISRIANGVEIRGDSAGSEIRMRLPLLLS
ncbi:MAG: ATP-binding protein [Solirubrobacterales bacterium]